MSARTVSSHTRRISDVNRRMACSTCYPVHLAWTCQAFLRISRQHGVKWIAYRSCLPPTPGTVLKQAIPSETFILGLFIWRNATETEWLVFEQGEPDIFGRVILTNDQWHPFGNIPFHPPHPPDNNPTDEDRSTESEFTEGEQSLLTFDDCVVCLNYKWSQTIAELESPWQIILLPDVLIDQLLACMLDMVSLQLLRDLPANAPLYVRPSNLKHRCVPCILAT